MLPGESRTEKVQVKIRVYHVPIGERGAEKVQLQIRVYHVSKSVPCSYIGGNGVETRRGKSTTCWPGSDTTTLWACPGSSPPPPAMQSSWICKYSFPELLTVKQTQLTVFVVRRTLNDQKQFFLNKKNVIGLFSSAVSAATPCLCGCVTPPPTLSLRCAGTWSSSSPPSPTSPQPTLPTWTSGRRTSC